MTSGNRPGGANPTGQPTGGGVTSSDKVRDDLAGLLNRLIRFEYDVGAAYESALHRIEDDALREVLKQQEVEHGGHIERLQARVGELGHKAADRADYHRILDQARVVFGEMGGKAGVLRAMRANLDELRDHFRAALDNPGFVHADREVLEKGYLDSERHARELSALVARS